MREIMDTLGVIPHGWCSPEKAIAMVELILDVDPRLVVEIGVFGAKSLVPQIMAVQHLDNGGVVCGIDPWSPENDACADDDPINAGWWKGLNWDDIYRSAVDQVWGRGLQSRCVLMRCYSWTCADVFHDIDIIHIDGNHSELTSTRDVELYLPKVKPGGYIWFDDARWKQTQKAVAMLNERCRLIKQVVDSAGNACNLYQTPLCQPNTSQ